MNTVISIKNLYLEYKIQGGSCRVLDDICLDINKGTTVGFIGPNGAGKTSTIKVILGFVPPTKGEVSILGIPISQKASRQTIGYLPECTYYYEFLTPYELLLHYGRFFNIEKKALNERIDNLLELVELKDYKNKFIKTFSKGMMQRVGLAQSLINDPELLILDEPTSGLDPVGRIQVRNILNGLKKQGKTIFFSSHELSEVELITDYICIINKGRILKYGSRKDLLANTNQNLERFFLEIIMGRNLEWEK